MGDAVGSKVFFFSIAFIVSTFLSDNLPLPVLIGLCAAVAVIAAVRFFLCNKELTMVYVLLFIIAGAGNMHLYATAMDNLQRYEGNDVTLYGTVSEVKYHSVSSAQYIIENKQINENGKLSGVGKYTKLTVLRPNMPFQTGDNLRIDGTLTHINSLVPQGGFDAERYNKSKNIAFEITAAYDKVTFIDKEKFTIGKWPQLVREKMTEIISENVDPDNRGILAAMIAGDKSLLDSYQQDLFNNSGTSHILAVSGLHVGILLLFLTFFLKRLRLPRPVIKILSILSLLAFMFVMNFAVSVVRAVIMSILLIISQLFFEENDPLSSLSIAAVIIIAVNPFAIYDASFLLSFGAMLGISLFYKPIEHSFGDSIPKFAKANFALSISSSIIIFPVLVYFFNRFSLISPFTNIIIIPIFTLLMFVGFCMLIISLIFAPAAAFLGFIANFLIEAIVWILKLLTAAEQTILTLKSPGPIEFLFYFALIYLLYQFLTSKKWKVAVLIFAFATSGFLYYTISESFMDKIYFMSGSAFDSTLVQSAFGKNALICGYNDSIDDGNFDYSVNCLVSNLAKAGIDQVDYFIPANQDPYTARILADIKNDIQIDSVLLPPQELQEEFINQLERSGIPLNDAGSREIWLNKSSSLLYTSIDSVLFRLQEVTFIADSNLRYGGENRMREHLEQSDVYKAQTVTADDLQNVRGATVALILAPHEEKLKCMEQFRASVPTTDFLSVQESGTVTVKVRRDKIAAVNQERKR